MRGNDRATSGRSLLALGGFAAAVAAGAAFGARFSPASAETRAWYAGLRKPPFNPPDWVFGPVWTGLYALIAASGWRVWRAEPSPARSRALVLWSTQMGLNAAWSYLFFGRREPGLALADLALLLAAIGAYTAQAAKVDRPAAAMMVPYLAWVSFAGLLNEEIVRLNP